MIKGVLFDYGGTIDTNGLHWGSVLWEQYQKHNLPVTKEAFSKAYSFGERALAINPIVKPEHCFLDVLLLKTEQQFFFLKENGVEIDSAYIEKIASDSNTFARETVARAKPTLERLAAEYPLVMVSNFYGNLNAVLTEFDIRHLFNHVVESAVVGVRKPSPQIYQLGVEQLNLPASECVVVGDSYSKDIIPGHTVGCQTIWINVAGWEETNTQTQLDSVANFEITDFVQIPDRIQEYNSK
jgi:HAD superfamily hydrolase (TIGR01549 family)